MINFDLRLGDTYWSKGFFNVSVDFQRHLTMTDGPIQIFLGDSDTPSVGRISRSANRNATPRIFGNKPLADFLQSNFKKGGTVQVEIISLEAIRIGGRFPGPKPIVRSVGTPLQARFRKSAPLVSADQPSTWRRGLIGILNELDSRVSRATDEGVAKRIQRLSNDGVIPREVAAMMRVVTEMRNMTEYQAKVLSASESAAVTSAWDAIRQWADTRGLKK